MVSAPTGGCRKPQQTLRRQERSDLPRPPEPPQLLPQAKIKLDAAHQIKLRRSRNKTCRKAANKTHKTAAFLSVIATQFYYFVVLLLRSFIRLRRVRTPGKSAANCRTRRLSGSPPCLSPSPLPFAERNTYELVKHLTSLRLFLRSGNWSEPNKKSPL